MLILAQKKGSEQPNRLPVPILSQWLGASFHDRDKTIGGGMDKWIGVGVVALVVVMVFVGALVVLKRLFGPAFESLNNGVFFYGQGDDKEDL